MCDSSSNVALRKNPITGIAACCARAASGHAAVALTWSVAVVPLPHHEIYCCTNFAARSAQFALGLKMGR